MMHWLADIDPIRGVLQLVQDCQHGTSDAARQLCKRANARAPTAQARHQFIWNCASDDLLCSALSLALINIYFHIQNRDKQ